MEFPFSVVDCIGPPPFDHVGPYCGIVTDQTIRGSGRQLYQVLEELGKNSQIAQGLKKAVTFGSACLGDQRVYLLAEGNIAYGFLKVGPKKLFIETPPANSRDRVGVQDAFREITPMCALDFYVHESCQRSGFGRRIFDEMLQGEGLRPSQMAYDRPSSKFTGFLRKHFNLTRFRPQNNNYVVFDDYFEAGGVPPTGNQRGRPASNSLGSGMSNNPLLGGPISGTSSPSGSRGNRERHRSENYYDGRPPALPGTGSGPLHGGGGGGSASGFDHPFGDPRQQPMPGAAPNYGGAPQHGYSQASNGNGQYAPCSQPWGTDRDDRSQSSAMSGHRQRQPPPYAAETPSGQGAGGGRGGDAAGRNTSRSSSCLSSAGRADSRDRGNTGGSGRAAGSVSGNSQRRFESPLSHAGSRMLQG